jgi:hypothetical protein
VYAVLFCFLPREYYLYFYRFSQIIAALTELKFSNDDTHMSSPHRKKILRILQFLSVLELNDLAFLCFSSPIAIETDITSSIRKPVGARHVLHIAVIIVSFYKTDNPFCTAVEKLKSPGTGIRIPPKAKTPPNRSNEPSGGATVLKVIPFRTLFFA